MLVEGFKYRLHSVISREPSVNAFAKKCGCTEGVLRSYLAGKSLPGLDKLVSIAKAGNVSVEWLATGEGEEHPLSYRVAEGHERLVVRSGKVVADTKEPSEPMILIDEQHRAMINLMDSNPDEKKSLVALVQGYLMGKKRGRAK